MDDAAAEKVLLAALELAVVIRDEGPDAVLIAAREVLRVAGGDAIAAICGAALAINPNQPLDRFWDADTVPSSLRPCGTQAAYVRHRRRGEPVDALCRSAHTRYCDEGEARRKGRAA